MIGERKIMVITIEELLAFKAKYEEQIKELERYKAVIDDLIGYAEAKIVEGKKTEESVEIPVEEPVVETENMSSIVNY